MGRKVRDEYFWKFSTSMSADIQSYIETHRYGDAFNLQTSNDLLEDASLTGQVFPANSMIRTCIEFGLKKKAENKKSCRKNYRKSDSHSPGIFTA